jgi:TPP-dependent indolepyruvate ferredoxin oxidoreductase alpha subunit
VNADIIKHEPKEIIMYSPKLELDSVLADQNEINNIVNVSNSSSFDSSKKRNFSKKNLSKIRKVPVPKEKEKEKNHHNNRKIKNFNFEKKNNEADIIIQYSRPGIQGKGMHHGKLIQNFGEMNRNGIYVISKVCIFFFNFFFVLYMLLEKRFINRKKIQKFRLA